MIVTPGMNLAPLVEVLENRARWCVMRGEMLDALRQMPTASVDALITDPPYSSGGAFRGDRMNDTTAKYVQSGSKLQLRPDFAGDNRDQRSFEYWCAMWLAECLRIAKPGAVACIFTDWRQLPSITDAVQAGGWIWRGIVPWDKTEATRPQMGRPRAQCEYVVWCSAGAMELREEVGVLPGIIREGVASAEKLHIAGKPIAVMSELARYCVPGGVILDPFCGSASTGVGALRRGRRFIGVEIEEVWARVSTDRLSAEEAGLTPAEARAGQTSMLDALNLATPPDSTGTMTAALEGMGSPPPEPLDSSTVSDPALAKLEIEAAIREAGERREWVAVNDLEADRSGAPRCVCENPGFPPVSAGCGVHTSEPLL